MSRRERMERRADQREMWAAGATAKAAQRFRAADAAVEGIPFGQPILVGHHSEKRHRAALERCDTNMRAGIERTDMAKRHEFVAGTLRDRLETNIFSDDANAIEQLEARIAEREAECDRVTELNKGLRRELKAGGGKLTAGAFERLGCTPEEIQAIERNARYSGQITFPGYVNSNRRNLIRADRERIKAITRQAERTAQAEAAGGVLIKPWPAHYEGDRQWCTVTFADKPERRVIDALKAAGYQWSAGSWSGYLDKLPLDDQGEVKP
jgi:hypothetical protein